MSLTIAVNNALTGLNVNQQALQVLSQNIANANTPGYSRQSLNQASVSLDGIGEGVSVDTITRKIDDYLNQATQAQSSNVGLKDVVNDYYSRLQLMMGNPGSQNSIDSYINGFFNSLQALSQSPDNTTQQRLTVNSGNTLATQVHDLAFGLQGLQFQAETDMSDAVDTVNKDLKELFTLNRTIAQNGSLGKSVADLEDRRDTVINDISKYIDVHTFKKSGNVIFLTTAGGISIMDDNLYQLSYKKLTSQAAFTDSTPLDALTVFPADEQGNVLGPSQTLGTSGAPSDVTTLLSSGRIAGLYKLRDELLPNIMSQLDTMAAMLRDQVNAIQNAGTGYPGTSTLTGTRPVFASDYSQWTGSIRIALLDQNGKAAPSPYLDEPNGLPPFELDLGSMNTGQGKSYPSVQGIVDAINQYYGIPQNKLELGNLNNIQLVSDSASLPNSSNSLSFDFNLNNISSTSSSFFVTGLQVKDNLGNDITSITNNVPAVALDPLNTYVTSPNSNKVVISTTTINHFSEGQMVYLSLPPGPVDGIPAAQLSGFFKVTHVTNNSFEIAVGTNAVAGGSFAQAGMTAAPPYGEVASGETQRTSDKGIITASLTGNTASTYYDVIANVTVIDEAGQLSTSQVTYRVNNQQPAMLGRYFGAQSSSGGKVVLPTTIRPQLTASLVDANGKELPKSNGQYTLGQQGYLKIQAGNSSYTVAIDSIDSQELGRFDVSPTIPGTNRSFSHFFELNNFFKSNKPTVTGDTIHNSALNMAVESRVVDNPGIVSLGKLTKSPNPVDVDLPPNFTYRLNPGDNSVIARLAALGTQVLNFSKAGGLGATSQTMTGYTAQILGNASSNAADAKSDSTNADALLQGYTLRSSSISGVNLDTELANTVIYQNAYAASARVITVANTLFDDLLQSFRG